MKKKRNFLLLEILIAILIVSICLVPLIQNPIRGYQAEMRMLEEMERARLADASFLEVKERLLKNEIPWEKLPLPKGKSPPFSLPNGTLDIPGARFKEVKRSFVLYCFSREKQGTNGDIYRMLRVDILLEPKLKKEQKYSYHTIVRKVGDNSQNSR